MSKLYKTYHQIEESNIRIITDDHPAIRVAITTIQEHREELWNYVRSHSIFRYALDPLEFDPTAPTIVQRMLNIALLTQVGPMAAVAGVLADLAVESMVEYGANVALVENGGEVSINSTQSHIIGLYAGLSPLSSKLAFKFEPQDYPMGIGTSSASVGHALTFGEADAATVFCDNAGLADAMATVVCNEVKGKHVKTSIEKGLNCLNKFANIKGIFIVRDGCTGSVGWIPRLVSIQTPD